MQSRGIDFLCPIWQLIKKKREGYDYYRNKPEFQGLDLSDGQVVTFYTTYVNDYKRPLHQNEISIRDAVRKRLTPGTVRGPIKLPRFKLHFVEILKMTLNKQGN